LPNLLSRLPLDRRKTTAVSDLLRLYHDPVKEVRIGVLEVLGEVIYKFAPNCHYPSSSPPIELIDIFLGPAEESRQDVEIVNTSTIIPDQNSTPTSGSLRSLFERKTDNYARFSVAKAQEVDLTEISQRDLICAYNYPAVLLTVGAHHWQGRLRDYYLKLWTRQSYKIQHTLAASLVEIASIIGPEHAVQDLLPRWKMLLNGEDSQIRLISIRHVRSLYGLLSSQADKDTIVLSLFAAWDKHLSGWRERLGVAELTPILSDRSEDEFVLFFGKIIRDPVAAVRMKVVELVCRIYKL
jgi:serine/threonine-protein phosphatase 4 regulatory subunit 1